MSMRADFIRRLRARDPLIGTFVKSRDPATIELLGHAGFDFAILDAEHGAFDRGDIATMAMASRAACLPLLVRVPATTGGWIATALDAGCAGILAPQVAGAQAAEVIAQAMRYGAGGRGFSPSVPGADYGIRGVAAHLEWAAQECALVCQIEDTASVEQAAAIAAVDGVDALLLGPVDLAVSMGGTDPAADAVAALCRMAIEAGAGTGKVAGLFLTDPSQRADWARAGATLFVLGSDQGFLSAAAKAALAGFRKGQ
jgi:2-keto-3-deoxy-L-rhamnonate aldolase RhmA